jgi:hypothetical protein
VGGAHESALSIKSPACVRLSDMRVLLVLLLAGCLHRGNRSPDGSCDDDSQCGDGEVCARNEQCLPQAEVHAVHVTWTIDGQPANRTTCDPLPALEIEFEATGPVVHAPLAFSPVACDQGSFPIDKLPTAFTTVKLGSARHGWKSATIDATTGEAVIDLVF